MSLATTAPASAAAARDHAPEAREDARLREAAARIATSLARYAAVHSRRSTLGESPVITEHVVAGRAVYRIRGELLEQMVDTPAVLVVAERDPQALLSQNELRKAYHLTHTEARVAVLLTERMSNREVARTLGATLHTARRHTESVLLKLGVTRRTDVHRELLRRMERSGTSGGSTTDAGKHEVSGADHPDQFEREIETGTSAPGAGNAGLHTGLSPRRRSGKRRAQSRRPKEIVIALVSREHERQAIRNALPESVDVRFAERLKDVLPPWRSGVPSAILVDLREVEERKLERALRTVQGAAPTAFTWAYVALERASVQEAVRLASRGLIADVITTADALGVRLRALLASTRVSTENQALWGVWDEWAGPGTREIVAASVDASIGPATVRDAVRRLDRSQRAIDREMSESGLPTVQRVLMLCRLLRAAHRLDVTESSVKEVAAELGYPSAHSLARQLSRRTGLTMSGLQAVGAFKGLAALVQAELGARRGRSRGDSKAQVANVARSGSPPRE